jgi:hypothetical protein
MITLPVSNSARKNNSITITYTGLDNSRIIIITVMAIITV